MTSRSVTLVAVLLVLALTAHAQRMGGSGSTATGPNVIVYKTKKNFDKYVPVILSSDKRSIVSYPAPTDIYYHGKLAYPTKLVKGYLLDHRGINIHSAFLDLTYREYCKLTEVDPRELMHHILSSDPFVAFYVCGKRDSFPNLIPDLKKMIRSGGLAQSQSLLPRSK